MSATDELRRLLDERGVEYEVDDAKTVRVTRWRAYGDWVSFIEYDNGDTKFCIDARRLTPEQAIAATLGAGTCHNTSKVTDAYGQARFACSECRAWIDLRALWNPDYPNGESPWVRDCKLNYCPNCGAKVVDE